MVLDTNCEVAFQKGCYSPYNYAIPFFPIKFLSGKPGTNGIQRPYFQSYLSHVITEVLIFMNSLIISMWE